MDLWEDYVKLRAPLEKRLNKVNKDENDLMEIEEMAVHVLDAMDDIPRDGLQNPSTYDDLRMMHKEELVSIRKERHRRGCSHPLNERIQFGLGFDASKYDWSKQEVFSLDDMLQAASQKASIDSAKNSHVQEKRADPPTMGVPKSIMPNASPPPSNNPIAFPRNVANVPLAQAPPVMNPRPSMRSFLPKNFEEPDSRRKALRGQDDDDDSGDQYSTREGNRRVQQGNPFQTAGEKLAVDRKSGKNTDERPRGAANQKPSASNRSTYHPINPNVLLNKKNGQVSPPRAAPPPDEEDDVDPRLKSCDPELISKIELEIVDAGDPISFDDIAGLHFAKKCVNELVIWPMARPDIFTGLRSLPKGLLLFGPPGTGKTLIGKAIATQSGATFFSISASSLTSKWIGEGEKLVRTLFAVAAVKQPSVIFIDEIDSLLSQRSSTENEASRRMKTEFLVQLDGAGTKSKDIILVVGATNRPQELDEAARRRFVKRLYIPLPSAEARMDMVNRLLSKNSHSLTTEDKDYIVQRTKGFSGADVRSLCTEAAMGPIRNCLDIRTMDAELVRPINRDDFNDALRGTRSSVSVKDLEFYMEWNSEFGSYQIENTDDDVN
ncbi:Aste57867_9088 [Aphanomyces stellatus]|uniref:Aste57867_9088 protein n=1 Tax=Aphanomyces stellatus TaxID=120398 RepID=A0A485KM20_9STRA|nr:hypothetical protein As57867_009052 [Aphanomyces stellatus]VFT85972.1 Aste57867_9088 [Aphanomyces stellatus]